MLNTTDQLYKGGKNKCSHPPVKCQKVESQTFQFSFVNTVYLLKHLISCQLFVHFLSVKTAMGERVQATYPRPGNLFYSFKKYYLLKRDLYLYSTRSMSRTVTDSKKFNLLCFSVGNLVKKR